MANRTNVLKVKSERSNHKKYVIVEIPETENDSSIKWPCVAYVITYWLGKFLMENFTGVLHMNFLLDCGSEIRISLVWGQSFQKINFIMQKWKFLRKKLSPKDFSKRVGIQYEKGKSTRLKASDRKFGYQRSPWISCKTRKDLEMLVFAVSILLITRLTLGLQD